LGKSKPSGFYPPRYITKAKTSLISGDIPGSSSACAYSTSLPFSTNVPPKRSTPSGTPVTGSPLRTGARAATFVR
jgi:hypothetical protein